MVIETDHPGASRDEGQERKMRDAIKMEDSTFSMVHVPVRQAIDDAWRGVGPKPPYSEAVYESAIRAGAFDEWRIMCGDRVHMILSSEQEADAIMDEIARNAAAIDSF